MRKGRGGLVVLKITKKNVYPACPINDLLSIKTVFKFKTRYFGLKYYKLGHFTTYFSQLCITFGVASLLFIYRMVDKTMEFLPRTRGLKCLHFTKIVQLLSLNYIQPCSF